MDCGHDAQRPAKDKDYYLNSTKRLIDKKERFRKYLETTGVLNKLTGVLIDLYENPVRADFPVGEYVNKTLSDPSPVRRETARTRQMLAEAKSARDAAARDNERLSALLSRRIAPNRNDDDVG